MNTSLLLCLLKRGDEGVTAGKRRDISAGLKCGEVYCVQVWRPRLQYDIRLLKRVQHHMMRMISGYKHAPLDDRLAKLTFIDLTQQRITDSGV